jgi:S-adenosylmethionine hydrolase
MTPSEATPTSSRRRFGVLRAGAVPLPSGVMTRPLVSLLTDFGLRDPSAAICRAVILGICPDAELLDLAHDVRKYAIGEGALSLWAALPYVPVGVHVAVVDPGVGTARRPVALRVARGDVLVGPDNGLLVPAAERLGGVTEARELVNPAYRLPVVTATFHGRDVFAPGAGHVASGVPFDSVGPTIDVATLVPSPLPAPRTVDGGIDTEIVYVDTFGNVKLSALAGDVRAVLGEPVGRRFRVTLGDGREHLIPWSPTFGERREGEPLLYEDSYGRACIGVNRGDAAGALGLTGGLAVSIRPGDDAPGPAAAT